MHKKPSSIVLWDDAAKHLINGKIGVIPTDTVYGLVALATDIQATTRLYGLKNREHKPGTIIAANVEQLENLGLSKESLKTAQAFWPGPVSIILNAGPDLEYLHQATGSIAARVVANKELRNFLETTGPLITSSANQPGQPVSNSIEQAKKYFDDKVDFYVDGGIISDVPPSTIIKIDGDKIDVIREGAVAIRSNGCHKT